MNDFKRCRIENLVRSIDRAKERISYWEKFNQYGGYDILIRLNISNKEPEVVKYEDDIVKQIIDNYKRDLERYNKRLDELLNPNTTGKDQYDTPKKRGWLFRKENRP